MGRTVYTPEMKEFILANYKGISSKELTIRLNTEFGTSFTDRQIKTYKSNHKLKSEAPRTVPIGYGPTFPAEINQFIKANYKGVGYHEIIAMIQEKFGVTYTMQQIKSFYGNNKLNSGLTGRFEKGHVPHNKGNKGCCAPGSENTWFKKGNRPTNQMEVGEERTMDGYIYVKIAQPNVWKQKHRIIWEAEHGPIPDGYVIIFRDGDRKNCSLENLMMVEKRIMGSLNKKDLIGMNGDLKETAVAIAKVKVAIGDAKRKIKKKDHVQAKRYLRSDRP